MTDAVEGLLESLLWKHFYGGTWDASRSMLGALEASWSHLMPWMHREATSKHKKTTVSHENGEGRHTSPLRFTPNSEGRPPITHL